MRAIVTLGHSLGILAGLGCDEIQGWLLGRPMNADALGRFMRQEGPRLGPA